MEGESLFNDATSIVLFEIFFEMVKKLGEGSASMEGGLLQEGLHIILQIGWLAVGDSFLCFFLLFLLPLSSSSSLTSSSSCTSSSLPCWHIGVQLASRGFYSGKAEHCKRLQHCLSDQLVFGEMQLISGGQYSIQYCGSGIGVLTNNSNNKWLHYSAFVTMSSHTPTSAPWKSETNHLLVVMAHHRVGVSLSRTCYGHACKIKAKLACRWFRHRLCTRIPDQVAPEPAEVQRGKSPGGNGPDGGHGIPRLLPS